MKKNLLGLVTVAMLLAISGDAHAGPLFSRTAKVAPAPRVAPKPMPKPTFAQRVKDIFKPKPKMTPAQANKEMMRLEEAQAKKRAAERASSADAQAATARKQKTQRAADLPHIQAEQRLAEKVKAHTAAHAQPAAHTTQVSVKPHVSTTPAGQAPKALSQIRAGQKAAQGSVVSK